MSGSGTTIRVLTPRDAREYLRHRQRALEVEPTAFVTSPTDDLAGSARRMRRYLDRAPASVVLGAFADGLVASIGVHRDRLRKSAHRVGLWGLYVEPSSRRRGVGSDLVRAALDHARSLGGVARVHASVSGAADGARRICEAHGFRCWGVEDDVFRHDGVSFAAHRMVLELEA